MVILLRQAVRSVWRAKRSYSACVLLLAVGIMLYVTFNLLYRNLDGAMEDMYRSQRFGHVFAQVTTLPLALVERVEAVPGVEQADATLVVDARVDMPGENKIITLRISSFVNGEDNRLNGFHITRGVEPAEDGLLVSAAFAAAHGLDTGDTLKLVVEGRAISPEITGFAQSPEYVYAIPDTGQLFPDDEGFGYGYMTAAYLGTLTGRAGEATNLSLLLEEGIPFPSIEAELEDILAPYGIRQLIERKNQPSHAMLDQEVQSIGSMATSLPMTFIFMAAVILTILLKRIIEQDRGQIGTLKAFGYADRVILLHYMGYGALAGMAGGVAGVALGLAFNSSITSIILDYFHLPAYQAAADGWLLAQGVGIGVAAGALGALAGTRSVLRLRPSEAMRPPAPPDLRNDWVGRIPLLRKALTSYGFMAVRNITRNPLRSAFVVLGVAFALALSAFMASYGGMVDVMFIDQFTKVEVYDTKLTLRTPAPYTATLEEVRAVEGVRRVEGMLELPVELRHGHLKKSVPLSGVEEGSGLYHIYDNETGAVHAAPQGGIILSQSLADNLQATRGDMVTLRTPYAGDRDIHLPVAGVISTNLGARAYIRLDSLWEQLESSPAINSVLVDTREPDAIKEALLEAEGVAAITHQQEARQLYESLMDTYGALLAMMQVAGAGVAFAIIAATASISLSERGREYATMRVLGMHPREIGQVVGFEYWILTVVAVPPGILLTRGLKEAMAGMIDNELFSVPVHTAPSSFLSAVLLCFAAVALSNLLARRRIARFDMVEVLKERE